MTYGESPDHEDFRSLLSEQRHELMAAESLESDHDLAYLLQLEEALAASLAVQPSTSTSTSSSSNPILELPKGGVSGFAAHLTDELAKCEQEIKDREVSAAEMRRIREDLDRRIHDDRVARQIMRIPEDDWIEWGDNYEKPFGSGEGCSNSKAVEENDDDDDEDDDDDNDVFILYTKGLVSEERVRGEDALLAGLGVAICDPRDNLLLEVRKPLVGNGMSKIGAHAKALIEGLNAALSLDLKRITFYCDYYPLYQFVSGRWPPKQRKVALLVNQHRYCLSCMKQHVEVKLLHGMVPKCPHEGCKSELLVDSCRKFLAPKSIEIMRLRIREASIPATERIYCPYPRCSTLMSKSDVLEYAKDFMAVERSGARKCLKCHALFCINCKVPWHSNMTCHAYKLLNPHPPAEDVKLKSLATRNLWRQCVKCNHMIELAEGCYHMTCRCGYEFCYTCGAEWKNKQATCSCPLWDEDHIWIDQDRDFDEEEDEGEGEEDEYYDSDYSDQYF
ncbi:uncharacterized protein LOC132164147 isoform X2 [Corylus avellana]|uniref:uncharacterized protein LOC132164147 isoform X2 n=1 Tax=Corylus avellana TaxID=13451 RepID=UPI00286CE2CD|nr:uncharacterized protein LOC132164147 isoform X2 [Corylus avellana]